LYDGSGVYDGSTLPGETVYTTCDNTVIPNIGLCEGTKLTIKIGNPSTDNSSPSGQQTSGQFFLVQGNAGTENWFAGGRALRDFISGGCFYVDNTLPLDLMTGADMGNTIHGVEDLIRLDPTAYWDLSTNKPVPPNSPRVISIAMYDPRFPIQGGGGPSGGSGTNAEIPAGYRIAAFFVERVDRASGGETRGSVTGFLHRCKSGLSSGTTPGGPTDPKKIALVE
jgi:hypothetical protein